MAQSDLIIPIQVDAGDGKKTLKDLRNEVNSYKDALVNLDRTSEEYRNTLSQLGEIQRKINEITVDSREASREFSDALNEVEASESQAEEAIVSFSDVLNDFNDWMDESIASLDDLGETLDSVNAEVPANTIKSLRTEINGYKDELTNLDRGTKEYTDTLHKLADAQSQINNINTDVRASTMNLTDIYGQVTNVAKGVVGGFGALQSSIALLGGDTDKLAETFVKLQATMTLLQSLTALSSGVKSANIAFKAFNVTLLANPIVAVAAVVVLLATRFVDLKEELSFVTDAFGELWNTMKEFIPSLDTAEGEVSALTKVFQGLSTVIIRLSTGPLKVLIKLLKGDLKSALNEIGFAANIVDNFNDGFNRISDKVEEVVDDVVKSNSRLTKDIIEENEARLGSDFRYTSVGAALYRSYYAQLLNEYDTDSEEYRKANNQKLAFEREFQNRLNSESKKSADERRRVEEERLRNSRAEQDELLKQEQAYMDALASLQQLQIDRYIAIAKEQAYGEGVESRISWISMEIAENERLQQSLRSIISDPEASYEAQTKALGDLEKAIMQGVSLNKELQQSETDLLENRIELERLERENAELLNPDGISPAEEAMQQIEANNILIDGYQDLLDSETLTTEQRIALLEKYNTALEQNSALEKKLASDKKKLDKATLGATADFLNASSALLGENTAAGKAMAVSGATINTYLAGTQALASYPPPASYIALAATIATGLATVKNILSTDVPGVSGDSGGSVSAPSLPSMPDLDVPIQETHNNMNAVDEEFFGSNTRVYVSETDISGVQNRVQVAESEARF